ncbi:MAG: homoserine O- acetyltransferase [Geoglossum simile]|nr:MAG: homoserine O- acetyltransferase [Geoglossum simile]
MTQYEREFYIASMGDEGIKNHGAVAGGQYERVPHQPENPFASLLPNQSIAIIPSFTLESGVTLYNVPLAYTTRGYLSPGKDNVMVICHALTGSADVSDWWGPLMGGDGRAFDLTRFFIVCMNSLGSPYGSASPVTNKDGNPTNGRYGPEFPLTTIRDDVNLHKLLLDDLGIRQVAVVVGGSMGGMLVLEWAYFGKDYVRAIVPIATSGRHSAWGISWGEAQRQSIYSDPKYEDGYYSFEDPPTTGLGAARMSALLTYRSRDSFESRFGRNVPDPSKRQSPNNHRLSDLTEEHWAVHNEGHKNARSSRSSIRSSGSSYQNFSLTNSNTSSMCIHEIANAANGSSDFTDPQFSGSRDTTPTPSTRSSSRGIRAPTYFSAQSYLRYQGEKFVKRFDSNCYIAITRKLDTHDISRSRSSSSSAHPISGALSLIKQPALVIGIHSDGLFTYGEQEELAAGIPDARLRNIDSPEGHDAFLLQFEQVNRYILEFLREVLPDIMEASVEGAEGGAQGVGELFKSSTFGEAEVEDITAW